MVSNKISHKDLKFLKHPDNEEKFKYNNRTQWNIGINKLYLMLMKNKQRKMIS